MFIELPDVIILAGGMGTRLSGTVKNIPKSMAPVNGKPFLDYLLRQIHDAGLTRAIISTGYLGAQIRDFFGHKYNDVEIIYSHEDVPLGTGGAVKKAFKLVQTPYALIINGDTFFRIDLDLFFQRNVEKLADVTIALRYVNDASRYGCVSVTNEGNILAFDEKNQDTGTGLINGGIYLISSRFFRSIPMPDVFSLEKDFFMKQVQKSNFFGQIFNDYFLDIGIPEHYERAQHEIGESENK
ncbi:MAG: nucleotidyltransferase family protein [Lentimicrobium sp.]|nr:nucleotidyltransferase family protein [Lentimicrobium sp.]